MTKGLSFIKSVTTDDPIMAMELRSAEQILARLVANAYLADQPELLGAKKTEMPIMGSDPDAFGRNPSRLDIQDIRLAGGINARTP